MTSDAGRAKTGAGSCGGSEQAASKPAYAKRTAVLNTVKRYASLLHMPAPCLFTLTFTSNWLRAARPTAVVVFWRA